MSVCIEAACEGEQIDDFETVNDSDWKSFLREMHFK